MMTECIDGKSLRARGVCTSNIEDICAGWLVVRGLEAPQWCLKLSHKQLQKLKST